MKKTNPRPVSENRLVRLLQSRYPFQNPVLKKGIGDDAAVILPRGSKEFWIVTTDMLVENIDFRLEWISPRQLGWKSMAVNLSDLAAMGTNPRFFTVSLAVPSGISESWIMEFHKGLASIGNRMGAHLIGGDLSREEKHIIVSVTAIGESLNRKVLYRSGGHPGDFLYVTGELGRSAAGLRLLQNGKARTRSVQQRRALKAQREPEPRCGVGIWLAQSGMASCMMDLSDGLSMDLPRMCRASGVGAEIHGSDIPVFAECALWGCDPLGLALNGGEDYELLFAVPEWCSGRFEKIYPETFPRVTRIGRMTGQTGRISLIAQNGRPEPLDERGYDHFAKRRV